VTALPGLQPGSSAPASPEDVDRLLRQVPRLLYLPALEHCLFPGETLEGEPCRDELLRGFGDAHARLLADALRSIEADAAAAKNGGLEFLARTLRHFLSVQKLAPAEHPLVVGLYLRSHARKRGSGDTFGEIARLMDAW
jgi:hypothetical protein